MQRSCRIEWSCNGSAPHRLICRPDARKEDALGLRRPGGGERYRKQSDSAHEVTGRRTPKATSIPRPDDTAHAEILAIGAACGALENWRLEGCTLYATLEPCPMCAGAILNSRVAKVVYGSKDKRLGALGSTYDILTDNPLNRRVEVESGILGDECLEILKAFFRDLRGKEKVRPRMDSAIPEIPEEDGF